MLIYFMDLQTHDTGTKASATRLKPSGSKMTFNVKGGSTLWYLKKIPTLLQKRRLDWLGDHAEYFFYKLKNTKKIQTKPLKQSEVTIIVTSAGRQDYLEQTVESLRENLVCNNYAVKWFIIDDCPWATETRRYIEQQNFDLVIFNAKNRGLGYSLNTIYSHVDSEFVFHCEDDWLFLRPIPLDTMASVLKAKAKLRQMLLYREKIKQIDYPGAFDSGEGYALYEKRFSFNPHLTMTRIFLENYPFPMVYTERGYTYKVERHGYAASGVWGWGGKEYIRHLGITRKVGKF